MTRYCGYHHHQHHQQQQQQDDDDDNKFPSSATISTSTPFLSYLYHHINSNSINGPIIRNNNHDTTTISSTITDSSASSSASLKHLPIKMQSRILGAIILAYLKSHDEVSSFSNGAFDTNNTNNATHNNNNDSSATNVTTTATTPISIINTPSLPLDPITLQHITTKITNLSHIQIQRLIHKARCRYRDKMPKGGIDARDKEILRGFLRRKGAYGVLRDIEGIGGIEGKGGIISSRDAEFAQEGDSIQCMSQLAESNGESMDADMAAAAVVQQQRNLEDETHASHASSAASKPNHNNNTTTTTPHPSLPPISPQEESLLMQHTNLNRAQLRRQLLLLLDEKYRGQVTLEAKQKVKKWIRGHHGRLPTQSHERTHLRSITGWNQSQLNSYLAYIRHRKGQIGLKQRQAIREWMQKHRRMPTEEEKQQFLTELKINRYQLRNLMRNALLNLNASPLSDEKRSLLEKWYSQHQRLPTRQEKQTLSQDTQLSVSQVYNMIYKLHQGPPGVVTEHSRCIIREWLRQHNNEMPSKHERVLLQQQTGLNYSQLNTQLYYLRSRNKRREVQLAVDGN